MKWKSHPDANVNKLWPGVLSLSAGWSIFAKSLTSSERLLSGRRLASSGRLRLDMRQYVKFQPSKPIQHEKIDFLHFGGPYRLWTVIFMTNSQNLTFQSTLNFLNRCSQLFSIFSMLVWSDINPQPIIKTCTCCRPGDWHRHATAESNAKEHEAGTARRRRLRRIMKQKTRMGAER
jgi:hypothetical protein